MIFGEELLIAREVELIVGQRLIRLGERVAADPWVLRAAELQDTGDLRRDRPDVGGVPLITPRP